MILQINILLMRNLRIFLLYLMRCFQIHSTYTQTSPTLVSNRNRAQESIFKLFAVGPLQGPNHTAFPKSRKPRCYHRRCVHPKIFTLVHQPASPPMPLWIRNHAHLSSCHGLFRIPRQIGVPLLKRSCNSVLRINIKPVCSGFSDFLTIRVGTELIFYLRT